jgi:hypothetical protein
MFRPVLAIVRGFININTYEGIHIIRPSLSEVVKIIYIHSLLHYILSVSVTDSVRLRHASSSSPPSAVTDYDLFSSSIQRRFIRMDSSETWKKSFDEGSANLKVFLRLQPSWIRFFVLL